MSRSEEQRRQYYKRTFQGAISETFLKLYETFGLLEKTEIISDTPKAVEREYIYKTTEIHHKPQRDINLKFAPNSYTIKNQVFNEGERFYNNTTTVINNIYRAELTKPNNLLPIKDEPEGDGQTQTKVFIGAPITLAESLKNQTFGKMLYNPFSKEKQKIRQVNSDNLKNNLENLNEEGIDKFIDYLLKEENSNVLDAIAVFLPTQLRGLTGETIPVYGANTIKYYFSLLTASSVNALIGVSDVIPNGYEIVEYELERPKEDNKYLDNLSLIRLSNCNNKIEIDLEEFGENPYDWEEWLKRAAKEQYDENREDNNLLIAEDLTQLIRRVLAVFYFRLGLDKFPIITPENLTIDDDKKEEETQIINHQLSDFLIWQFKAFDSVIGQFPIKIRIEDTDLIKTGDQSLELVYPNLSETIAELVGFALSGQTNNSALLELGLKNLAESGQTKQTAIQNYYLLAAIQEYLGFETKQISKEVDFLFNPKVLEEEEENQSLNKLLQPSKLKVPIESNIDENSLEKSLVALIEAARIIKGVHFRGIDLNNNPEGQIKNIFKQAQNLADSLQEKEKEKIDEVLENIEQGFTNKIPNKDPNRPFNRNYNERPKIKNIIKDGDHNIT